KSVQQFSMPIFVNLRPTEDLRFWLVDSIAISSLDNNGAKSDLNGINDTKAKVSYSIFDQKLLFSLGFNLPTGKEKLDNKEIEVANLLYDEVLGFRVNKLGSGFDINAGVALAMDMGAFGLSLSSSYMRRGSYISMENGQSKYKPGDELGITTAIDVVRDSALINADIGYTRYTADEVDGVSILKEGDEIKGRFFTSYRLDPIILGVSIADTYRLKNKNANENNELITETENSHGNRIDANLITQYIITRQLSINPLAGITFISNNDYSEEDANFIGSSFIWNAGGALQFIPNKNSTININAKYLKGNMKGKDTNISGYEFGTIILIKF
ncbi:MAG: hypothetical protein ACPL7B_05420, partial [Candidatus Poribacteria bacterium]